MKLIKNYQKSPLNYTGGKYKLLPQIEPLFPQNINTFVDMFCGGLDVSINAKANNIIANDRITPLISLYKWLQVSLASNVFKAIHSRILELNLQDGSADAYNKLRSLYNKNKSDLDFLLLIFYSFNHQIRFNQSCDFNMPNGVGRYNQNIDQNLRNFVQIIKSKQIKFVNKDFREFDISGLGSEDFVYCDPPYLISIAAYNDG